MRRVIKERERCHSPPLPHLAAAKGGTREVRSRFPLTQVDSKLQLESSHDF